jgi:hypothetical protein
MPANKTLLPGLNPENCIGPAGGYRRGAIADRMDLATCTWDTDRVVGIGPGAAAWFRINTPPAFSREEHGQDWTGKTIGYRWDGGGVDMELRASLPGVLLIPEDREVPVHCLTEVHWIVNLETGGEGFLGTVPDVQGSRFYLLKGRRRSMLVVASQPLRLSVVSHAFWSFGLPRKGGRLMLVPLIDEADAPSTPEQFDTWLEILRRPPLRVSESYAVDGNELTIRQEFAGSAIAPVPPLLAHLDNCKLMELPGGMQRLLTGSLGPYRFVRGGTWSATIGLDWTGATLKPTREITGRLAPIPEELAYAGDVTWSKDDPMDQLLALRIWAPLLAVAPTALRDRLVEQLPVPSAKAYRESLETVTEPISGVAWAKEDLIFDLWGDVSYDPDWYNGLSLSGLERACRCSVESIARQARQTAAELRPTRDKLIAFYELFHCWAYCSAPSDPQATFWNSDCSHNGLEGLLAEARMRRDEGDEAGADRMLYLAGKTAAGLLALQLALDWCRQTGFVSGPASEEVFGANGLAAGRGVSLITADTKAPYNLVNNFPEYVALLKRYGCVETLRRQVRAWCDEKPERYRDWIRYYIGPDEAERLTKMLQEDRVQSAVFYHLSPEIWLRRFVLEEDPDEIEKSFRPRINLAEQLALRSGMTLSC